MTDDLARITLYQDGLLRLANTAEATITKLWESDDGTFSTTAVGLLDHANARAWALADFALALVLTDETGSEVLPIGLAPETQAARLHQAIETITVEITATLEIEPGPSAAALARLRRLARSTPLEGAAYAWHRGLIRHNVGHWTRQADLSACEACRSLVGKRFSTDTAMWRHKGCGCVARPVP